MPLPCAPRQEAPESVSDWCFPRSSRTWVQSLHERSLASIMLLPAGLVVGGSSKCQSCKQGSRVQSWLVQEWRSAGRSLPSDERPALTGGSAPVHHHPAGCEKADVHEGESPAMTGFCSRSEARALTCASGRRRKTAIGWSTVADELRQTPQVLCCCRKRELVEGAGEAS